MRLLGHCTKLTLDIPFKRQTICSHWVRVSGNFSLKNKKQKHLLHYKIQLENKATAQEKSKLEAKTCCSGSNDSTFQLCRWYRPQENRGQGCPGFLDGGLLPPLGSALCLSHHQGEQGFGKMPSYWQDWCLIVLRHAWQRLRVMRAGAAGPPPTTARPSFHSFLNESSTIVCSK